MPMDMALLLSRMPQKHLQIGAVDAHMGRTITLCACRQRHLPHHTPITGIAGAQVLGEHRHSIQRILQAPGAQNPRHIGTQLNARTLGGQLRRTLHHIHTGTRA